MLTRPRREVGAAAEGPALRTPLPELSFFLPHKLSLSVGVDPGIPAGRRPLGGACPPNLLEVSFHARSF